MEIKTKQKIEKAVKVAVYEGLPLVGGVALAAALVPLDGGITLAKTSAVTVMGVAKFGLVSIVGYGAIKSAITPDQMLAFEQVAQKLASRVSQIHEEEEKTVLQPVTATA